MKRAKGVSALSPAQAAEMCSPAVALDNRRSVDSAYASSHSGMPERCLQSAPPA